MQEQEVIVEFLRKIQYGLPADHDVALIKSQYRRSLILQYYLGVYYEKMGDNNSAISQFETCIQLNGSFAPPYFHLATYWRNMPSMHSYLHKTLLKIFNKDTLDAKSFPPRNTFQMADQLNLCAFLFPLVSPEEAMPMYLTMIQRLRIFIKKDPISYLYVEGWKNLHSHYAALLMSHEKSPCESIKFIVDGMKSFPLNKNTLSQEQKDTLHTLDQTLLLQYCVIRNYCLPDEVKPSPLSLSSIYNKTPYVKSETTRSSKIRIGYLSPDFNKNAVGLFLTALIKHFNSDKFEVYIYYNNKEKDEFTELFMSYPNIMWNDVYHLSDDELYQLIHDIDAVDILVDLIGLGIDNRVAVISRSPAPFIINYLGYPDFTHNATHRLVDSITDPIDLPPSKTACGTNETLLRMPRCFLCYQLFENVVLPEIKVPPNNINANAKNSNLRIGIMNRWEKCHPSILEIWKSILATNKNIVLCVKAQNDKQKKLVYDSLGQQYKKQIEFLPFAEDLPSYLQQYNTLDICMDTSPYSGTTTTCSALLMGVPVATLYDGSGAHVSNVSASLLKHCGEDISFICSTKDEYKERIVGFVKEDRGARLDRRTRFLAAMDPVLFMADYESIIESLYSS